MRFRSMVLTVCVCLAAAACGSTNKPTANRAKGSAASPTPIGELAASAEPGASDVPGSTSASGGRSKTTASTGGGTKNPGVTTATLPNVTPKPVTTGKGVKNSKVYVGFHVSKNLDTGFTAIGANQSTAGSTNERPMVDALVAWLNRNGGITGREVVPVIHEYDSLADGNWNQQATQACTKFTQDNEIAVLLTSHVGGTDALQRCMSAAKVPVVQQNQWPYDSTDYRDLGGFLFQPGRMMADRWAPAYLEGLKDAGYFSGATVGLLRFSGPVYDRLVKRYDDTMDRLGLKIHSRFTVNTPQGVSDFGAMNAQFQNAILQFQRDQVTHVIFAEYGSIMPFFFTTAAEQQGFRPRYGVSSVDLPATMASQNPEAQLTARGGALAISWTPAQDVKVQQDPRMGKGGAFDRCRKIMTDAGITPPHPLYTGLNCENVFLAKQAFDMASEVSQSGFPTGVEALGDSFDSPFSFGPTKLGPGRHDGAYVVRTAIYKASPCDCFEYITGERTVP